MEKKGGRILAISVDTPADSRSVVERDRLPFAILSDPDLSVTRKLGLLHPGGGPGGQDLAIPAQILLRPDASIAWRYVSSLIQDRSDPGDTLAAVNKL